MKAFLLTQARRYPGMLPQDVLKWAYQAAFGAEHMLDNAASALEYLRREWESCPPSSALPLMEAIGPDTCRVHLAAWKYAGLPLEGLGAVFVRSCAPRAEGEQRFFACLQEIDTLADQGLLPFSAAAWQAARWDYLARELRPVHHSDAYRAAWQPAYRVIDYRYARALALYIQASGAGVIALDGRCASGKTTLAADMAALFGAGVVHMDDFFLPPEMRTEDRLAQPGGNVHHERFAADVLPFLRGGQPFAYPVFDCSLGALHGMRQVPAASLYVVEGAYSCHPALGRYMTVRAFSDIDPDTQLRRILARNGKAGAEAFRARWIPLEERYIAACGIAASADITLPAQADCEWCIACRPPRS